MRARARAHGGFRLHRRELMVLHAVLLCAALLLGWRLTTEWRQANARYQPLAAPARTSSAAMTRGMPQPEIPPTQAIIANNIFTADRNSDAPQDDRSKPAPPVPVVFGTMNLGGHYEALMAESANRPGFRRVKRGEKVGEYMVAEIADEKVVIDYQGQKTTLDVYQSANSVPRAQAAAAPAPAAHPAAPVVESMAAPAPQANGGPSAPAAATAAPEASDGTRITIEGNRRRLERPGPFGVQVWYEDLPK